MELSLKKARLLAKHSLVQLLQYVPSDIDDDRLAREIAEIALEFCDEMDWVVTCLNRKEKEGSE